MSPADIVASLEFLAALGEVSTRDREGVEALWAAMEPVLDELIEAPRLEEGMRRSARGGGYVAEGEVVRVGEGLCFVWRSLERG